jgi:hypothetical protein
VCEHPLPRNSLIERGDGHLATRSQIRAGASVSEGLERTTLGEVVVRAVLRGTYFATPLRGYVHTHAPRVHPRTAGGERRITTKWISFCDAVPVRRARKGIKPILPDFHSDPASLIPLQSSLLVASKVPAAFPDCDDLVLSLIPYTDGTRPPPSSRTITPP